MRINIDKMHRYLLFFDVALCFFLIGGTTWAYLVKEDIFLSAMFSVSLIVNVIIMYFQPSRRIMDRFLRGRSGYLKAN